MPPAGKIHFHDFVMRVERALAVFGLEGVYMDRSVGRLRGYVFIQRVPGDALDKVIMLCYLANDLAYTPLDLVAVTVSMPDLPFCAL